jgi:hypothetical protein
MVFATGRLFGIAVPAQISRHNGKLAGQRRRDLVPVQMIERVAVHQQDRGSLATCHGDDTGAAGLDLGSREAFEQHVWTWPCFDFVSRPCAGHPRLLPA